MAWLLLSVVLEISQLVEGVAAEAMEAPPMVPLANDGGWPNDGLDEAAPPIEERCITLELEGAGGWPRPGGAWAARGADIGVEEGGAGAANPEGLTAVGTAVIC